MLQASGAGGNVNECDQCCQVVEGDQREMLLPSEVCGWLATALSCCRGTVSNLTCLNPQMPTLTASCDNIPFTGEMLNPV